MRTLIAFTWLYTLRTLWNYGMLIPIKNPIYAICLVLAWGISMGMCFAQDYKELTKKI